MRSHAHRFGRVGTPDGNLITKLNLTTGLFNVIKE